MTFDLNEWRRNRYASDPEYREKHFRTYRDEFKAYLRRFQ